MDVCFELILPAFLPPEGVQKMEKTINWDGVDYPQRPLHYLWGKHVELLDSGISVPKHIAQRLPSTHFNEHWKWLSITGDGLDLWQRQACGDDIEWEGYDLETLLRKILISVPAWVVVFEWQSDRLESEYQLAVDECLDKIKANLAVPNPEGFLVFSK